MEIKNKLQKLGLGSLALVGSASAFAQTTTTATDLDSLVAVFQNYPAEGKIIAIAGVIMGITALMFAIKKIFRVAGGK